MLEQPKLTQDQIAAIRAVPGLGDGFYASLDLDLTLDYMTRRFVVPIAARLPIAECRLMDCAAGFGWLSFAYLLAGGKAAILVEPDAPRLAAALRIAAILGVADRCTGIVATLQSLRLDRPVEIVVSIETLEHVGKANVAACVEALARSATRMVVLTTPNRIFPQVAHDTALPFAHWLPRPPRHAYARACGRTHTEIDNHFIAPWDLAPLAARFRSDGRVGTFASIAEYRAFFPVYMPYGPTVAERHRRRPPRVLTVIHATLARLLGTRAYWLSPSLASIWLRRDG
ncbi:MAG: hypothetical protein JNM13_07875 [Hyphomicrobiaceae bacterium]|nr:hypothetical protein [Hyphomicrobiaceae bacterium]